MAEIIGYIQEIKRDVSPSLQRSLSYIALKEWIPGEKPWTPVTDIAGPEDLSEREAFKYAA